MIKHKSRRFSESPVDLAVPPNATSIAVLFNPSAPGKGGDPVTYQTKALGDTISQDWIDGVIAKINQKHPEEKVTGASNGVKALIGKKFQDVIKDNAIEMATLQGKLVLKSETGAGTAVKESVIVVDRKAWVLKEDVKKMLGKAGTMKEARRDEFEQLVQKINALRKEKGLVNEWEIGSRYNYYAIDLVSPRDRERHTVSRTVVSGLSRKDLLTYLDGAYEALI